MPLNSLDMYDITDIRESLMQVLGVLTCARAAANSPIDDFTEEIGSALSLAESLLLITLDRLETAIDTEDEYEQ